MSSTDFLDYRDALGGETDDEAVEATPARAVQPGDWKRWKQGLADFDAKLAALNGREATRDG